MQKSTDYKLEQAKLILSDGSETSLVYAVPSETRTPLTCVTIAHGAGGPMHSQFIRYFHTELARHGFITVKFNFPYMEAHRRFPDRPEKLEETYRRIIRQVESREQKPDRIIIGGKSMGGRIASQLASSGDPEIDGLYFLGYPLHPPGRTEQLRDEHLYKIKKPMLFLSGTRDNFARKDLLEKVLEKIGPNAQIHWIQDGDHSFKTPTPKAGDPGGTQQALSALLTWLERFS